MKNHFNVNPDAKCPIGKLRGIYARHMNEIIIALEDISTRDLARILIEKLGDVAANKMEIEAIITALHFRDQTITSTEMMNAAMDDAANFAEIAPILTEYSARQSQLLWSAFELDKTRRIKPSTGDSAKKNLSRLNAVLNQEN